MTSTNTVPGDPKNWPRTLARSAADLDDAIKNLVSEGLDEANMTFALKEFIRERITMVVSTLRVP